MRIEALTPLKINRAGEAPLYLHPGCPVEVSEELGARILQRLPGKVRRAETTRIVLRCLQPIEIEFAQETVAFETDSVFTTDLDYGLQLLTRHPERLEQLRLPSSTAVDPTQPETPLQIGWLVTWRDEAGVLRGGSAEQERATVASCDWDGVSWVVTLTNGETLFLRQIVGVGQTDQAGQLIAAWAVGTHGYDGGEGSIIPSVGRNSYKASSEHEVQP